MLQTVGVGIGGLAVSGFAGEVATAKTGCARGPFERTYEPGTVNVGQIRAGQAREDAPSPSIDPASPRSGAADGEGEQPPRLAAQESNVGEEGPLTIRTEYDGVNSLETRGGVPSDSQVAAGNGQLVHALNRNVAIYNKQSGRREQFFRLESLWEPVIEEPEGGFVFGTPFVFDPRARYDRNADRFVLCATQFQFGLTTDGERIDREDLEEAAREDGELDTSDISRPPKGWFLVAVSATSNPNGEWYVYRVPPEDASGVDNEGLVDYPTLGFDRDAVYMTQNFFGTTKFEVTMVTMDKAAMYAGETVTAYHFDRMNDPDSDGITFTVHPGQQPFSGGSDGTFYLANSDFPVPFPGPAETLTLWELTDPVDEPTLECFTLDVDPYVYPSPARQPETDSLVDTLGTRLMNVDFNDGSVWAAHSTAVDWNGDGRPVAAIRWYEIDARSRSVVQSGTYGEPGTSYFMPTVGSGGDATVIAHNVSGPDTFPRMDVAGRTADFTPGRLEDGIVVESGESKYNALSGPVERWGDYNGVSVDPASGRFWTVSQYSPDIDIPVEEDERDPYFTRIAEVYFEEATGGGNGQSDS
ncbi:hypothetical protein [Halorussus salinisoli]|uniref:hypothetical protein n=1 Tax=Halorussus salinisoli TaxID=2558242 RepID=UPI002A910D1A|nr:hypothetical protein [Halorussus salinisoli]